jgi:hypothetical protein
MQAVISNPAGVQSGLASDAAQRYIDISADDLEQVVTRSHSLAAAERLAIYSHAYFGRLQECLRAEFPVLLHALGEELFNLFTLEYLKYYPSRSYTLNRLGQNFSRYLAESRPDSGAPLNERESWPDFIVELATLERAFAETFDGPGSEGLSLPDRDSLLEIPIDKLLRGGLVPAPCLRLLVFRYPVTQYFKAARKKENPDLPGPANSYIAMNRSDFVVSIHDLTQTQYEVLAALTTGSTLGQLATGQPDQEAFIVTALGWLGDWAESGFFSAARTCMGISMSSGFVAAGCSDANGSP